MKIGQTGKELLEELRAVARGERVAPARPAARPFSALTAEVFELLNVLARTPTTTVSDLAQRLGKTQSEVSRTLQRLAARRIVRLGRDGQEVRAELLSTELKINLADRTVEALPPPE
jgi:DNA-binding MarR family transcriptional regulator